MATVTSVDGYHYQIDPSKVCAIADHDADTGQAVTCVYGILKARLRISETVSDFLVRLAIASQFAQLTRPNGSMIWINAKAVSVIREPLPGEYIDSVHAVVVAGGLTQGVAENVPQAGSAIVAHGGTI